MAQSSLRAEKRALKAKLKQPLQLCARISLLLGVVTWALFVGFSNEGPSSGGPLPISASRASESLFRPQHDTPQHPSTETSRSSRSLFKTSKADTLTPSVDPEGQEWILLLYILGIMYMFVALAIVCDDYFVPALEAICAPDGLDLDDDIAGATFMAAGGSAPELFTSFIGTMQDSAVGFGTIVGSAVFNVLFVIAMCAFFANEPLTLSWWPLTRDCSFYAVSLAVLAVFFSGISPLEIEPWEAAILLLMYIGYVVLMANNAALQERFDPAGFALSQVAPAPDEDEEPIDASNERVALDTSTVRTPVTDFVISPMSKDPYGDKSEPLPGIPMATGALGETGAPKAERKLSDEAPRTSLLRLTPLTQHKDTSGTLDIAVRDLQLDCATVHKELDTMVQDGHSDKVDFEQCHEASEPSENGVDTSPFEIPEGTLPKIIFFIVLPLQASLYITVPRCEDSGPHPLFGSHLRKWRWFAFGVSILWIGVYSLFMVDWASVAGAILGIPPEVMGLTFLAAGTSVPDLLSSVIVAQKGKGDMAVSSSIGSNIFDILVGLPIPWLAYYAVKQKNVEVKAKSLQTDIPILLGMLVMVVGTIAGCGWQLTPKLGAIMVCLYVLFLCQSLLNNDGFICGGGCFS